MGRARQKYRERPTVVADESKQKKVSYFEWFDYLKIRAS